MDRACGPAAQEVPTMTITIFDPLTGKKVTITVPDPE
jgi:hypothetical protein